jgi:hypothetical protein
MKNLKIVSVATALLLGASTFAMAKGGGGHGGGAHSGGGGLHSSEGIGSSSRAMSVDPAEAATIGAGAGLGGLPGSNAAVPGFPSGAIAAPSEIAPLGAGMTDPAAMTGPTGTGLIGTTGPAETSSEGMTDSCGGIGCRPSAVADPIGMIAAPPSIMAPPTTSGAR